MSIDRDRLAEFALRVWGYKQGEVVSLMVCLGDRLGLYKSLSESGPVTAGDLAGITGLHERWLLEWLRSQAAAGLIDTEDGDVFRISAEGATVLADDRGSIWFASGAFQGGAATPDVVERLVDSFRSGVGLKYDDLGAAGAHAVERMLEPWTRLALVPVVLRGLDGVVEKLESGASVADVGCGTGVAVMTMAGAFPASHFDGYDPSQHAIARAHERLSADPMDNVQFRLAGAEELPGEPTYDLVTTLDCIHDMPYPAAAMASIRRGIRPDGTWLIKDVRSSPRWDEKQRNPLLAMLYGTSVACCMSSALSEPGGAGLGTLGFHSELAEAMCREAGFSRFTVHDFEDPANLYYEVRP